ncbi:MAG: gliding motility-associated C-terminal domain-containing protein [Ferruginibacter sp.]
MKRILFTLSVMLLTDSSFCQSPSFQWVKQFQLSTTNEGHYISVDAAGNVYTLGSFFTPNTDFDPGPLVYNLTPNGDDDIFITKYDPLGNFIWAKNLGGPKTDIGRGIVVDAVGNVYATGYFRETADFDPGPGVYNLSCATVYPDVDIFVCKLDNNGNFVWAKRMGGVGFDIPKSISLDPYGNICTTGNFEGPADFDPGVGVFTLGSGIGVFISKLDNSGNFIWAKAPSSSSYPIYSNCVTTDTSGNVYITGNFMGTIDFDPGPAVYNLTSLAGIAQTFILKLDALGNFNWAAKLGAAFSGENQSVSVNIVGNVFVVWNEFLSKLDLNGNELWTKNIGGTVTDNSRSINSDVNGNIYVAGFFYNTVDLDPGASTYSLTAFGTPPIGADAFISKLDGNGEFIWGQQIGGISQDIIYSLFIDVAGNIYSTGSFQDTADFDPSPNVFSLYSFGRSHYVHKMSWCPNVTTSTITDTACNTYTLNGQTYISSGVYAQTLINATGCDSVIILNLTINGSNTTSSITACDSYTWQSQTYTASGSYSDTLISSSGCDSILNLNLTINYKVLSTVSATICQGQTYAGHSTTGTYVDTYVAANGCDSMRTLNLIVTLTLYSNISAVICQGQSYGGHIASGIYVDTLISVFGCDSIRTLNLTVNPRAFTSINASICEGQTYYAGGTNQTTPGIYKDTLLTTLGCDSIITTTLTVFPKPKPDLGADGNICSNAVAAITPGVFNSYLWQDNSTQPYFTVTTPGKYWVTVTGANNCKATDTINIIAIDTIPVNFLPSNQELCYGNVLKISVPGYASYLWSTGSTSNAVSLNTLGTFYLTVKDYNNCVGKDSITLIRKDCIFIGIPNAFTPNGDGKNDVFKPTIYQAVQKFSFIIFNRYGEKIFETRDYGAGWDGRYKGKDQPTGSYVYHIKFTNGFGWESENNGTVLLIR